MMLQDMQTCINALNVQACRATGVFNGVLVPCIQPQRVILEKKNGLKFDIVWRPESAEM